MELRQNGKKVNASGSRQCACIKSVLLCAGHGATSRVNKLGARSLIYSAVRSALSSKQFA